MLNYCTNNKDDLKEAINHLNGFTHNFCMNCTATAERHEPTFNCKECQFKTDKGFCLVKLFVKERLGYLPDNFGSMSR